LHFHEEGKTNARQCRESRHNLFSFNRRSIVKKTPAKKKTYTQVTGEQVVGLFRMEIKRRARKSKSAGIGEWVLTRLSTPEIARALGSSMADTITVCSLLRKKGELRFAHNIQTAEREQLWSLGEWMVTSWDDGAK